MKDKAFLDSNILLYFFDEHDSRKQMLARNLVESLLTSKKGQISTQTLQEYFNVVTKKLKCDKAEAEKDVRYYSAIFPVHTNTVKDILEAITISIKDQLSFYDSLIIAAAKAEGFETVYSEDLNDGQEVDGVKIVNPFKPE